MDSVLGPLGRIETQHSNLIGQRGETPGNGEDMVVVREALASRRAYGRDYQGMKCGRRSRLYASTVSPTHSASSFRTVPASDSGPSSQARWLLPLGVYFGLRRLPPLPGQSPASGVFMSDGLARPRMALADRFFVERSSTKNGCPRQRVPTAARSSACLVLDVKPSA